MGFSHLVLGALLEFLHLCVAKRFFFSFKNSKETLGFPVK